MQKQAFKLKLNSGQEAEYKRWHDTLWPELEQLLKETGIENYSSWSTFAMSSIDK
jgi:L-rhamnose mutarotase